MCSVCGRGAIAIVTLTKYNKVGSEFFETVLLGEHKMGLKKKFYFHKFFKLQF